MGIDGEGDIESCGERELPPRAREQIRAAHDLADFHLRVVDNDR